MIEILLYIVLIIILIYIMALYNIYLLNNKSMMNHNINNNYNKILNNLFLGDIHTAQNIDFIKKNNIKYIFNISNGIPNYFDYIPDIKYINLNIADDLSDYSINLMYKNLPKLVLELDTYLNLKNGNVLVHCYAGRQRSAIVIAGYLVYKYKMTPDEAYDFIIDHRPEAFHYGSSYNFHNSLKKYYNDLYN